MTTKLERFYHEHYPGVTYTSIDDAGIGNLDERRVVAVNEEEWE